MADSYVIYVQNPDLSFTPISCTKARLERPIQVDSLDPRILELTVNRSTAIKEGSVILAVKNGVVMFRGYVKFYSIKNSEKNVKVFGMEDLLNYRVTPKFFYDQYQTVTWGELFSSDCIPGAIPGLLAIANGYLVPGDPWNLHETSIIRLGGLGTNSDLGESDLYCIDATKLVTLPESASLAALIAAKTTTSYGFFRDENDLYINVGTALPARSWYLFGGIVADNHKDTSIRLGTCEPLGEVIDDCGIITDWSMIGDLIIDISVALGYHVSFTDDWDHTYVNITEAEGRGESVNGVYTFTEADLVSIEKEERNEPVPNALIGIGAADCRYKHDLHTAGVQAKIESLVTFETEFNDADGKLQSYVTEEYNSQTGDSDWTIEPDRCDLFFYPGDWIKLKLDYESEMLLKCVNIDEDCLTGHAVLELSQKKTDITDVFDYLNDAEYAFSQAYPRSSAPDNLDDVASVGLSPGTGTFYFSVPKGVLDADLKPRIIFTISIQEKYTSGVTTADLGDAGKINLAITIETTTWNFCGVPMGAMVPIDVTDAIAADDASQGVSYAISAGSTGTPADAKFTLSGTMEFLKRAN